MQELYILLQVSVISGLLQQHIQHLQESVLYEINTLQYAVSIVSQCRLNNQDTSTKQDTAHESNQMMSE